MCVEFYSSKLEFQGRGAAHNHGTIWVDMEKVEYMIEVEDSKKTDSKIEYNMISLDTFFDESEADFKEKVKTALKKCSYKEGPKTMQESVDLEQARGIVVKFGNEKLNKTVTDSTEIISMFKFVGIRSAYKKFQTHEGLLSHEESAVINFANKFITVCLAPNIIGEKVAEIAKKVNLHRHTKACKKYSTDCRFSFPKFPVWKTVVASPSGSISDKEKAENEKILKDVKDVLTDEKTVDQIMSNFNKSEENKSDFNLNRKLRIRMLLAAAGYDKDEDCELYLRALSFSKNGYSLILERDIDEAFVNPFNPEWILAWNGNLDIQICLDFFAVITYITEYFTKDDTGTMEVLTQAVKSADNNGLKDKMTLLMNTFITHRQIGEAEAVYKVFPDFHFKDSNIATIFFPNYPRDERSKFLVRVDDKAQYANLPKIKIENRSGDYVEKYDIVSKYERRVGLENLCAAQFAKMYEPSWKRPSDKKNENMPKMNERNKFHFIMTEDNNAESDFLPDTVELCDPYPNEPPYMKKRKRPYALRIHKFNEKADPKKYFFSEYMLYIPFREEKEIWENLDGNVTELEKKIRSIKKQVS